MSIPVAPPRPIEGRPSRPRKPRSLRHWPREWSRFVAFLRTPPGRLKPVVAFLALAFLIVVAAWGGTALWRGVDFRSLEQHRNDSDTSSLNASSVAQSFRSPRSDLDAVQVELGMYAGLPANGRVRLIEGDGLSGKVLFEAPLSKADFSSNPFLTVKFPPLAASQGMTYTLALDTPGRPLKSAIGIRYNSFDALSSGQMYLDGRPQPGDLSIAVYYHYTLTTLLGDILAALESRGVLVLSWLCLLLLPGLTLLVWLPNRLSAQQRFLAAPGVSLLALPVFLLLARAVGVKLEGTLMWVIFLLCAASLVVALWRARRHGAARFDFKREDSLFWGALASVLLLTLAGRLLALRDPLAGMGLDAYHHTLIAEMFVQSGGIPSTYEPYAPLSSFTYHFGFHALTAAVAWLSGLTAPVDMLALMPQAGQVATALPVLTLTLFSWRLLGNRWAGLAAGALAGLIAIFPSFYVNWSRYTQGLGLALLPVAWVLFAEVVDRPRSAPGGSGWRYSIERSAPYMLGVIGAAGLALTHYRIEMIYAGFVALFVIWLVVVRIRSRGTMTDVLRPLWRTALVAVLTVATLSPWLVNLAQNFGTRFVGKGERVTEGYYSLQNMVGNDLLFHWSLPLLVALSLGGIVWAVRRRDPLPLLPAITWAILGLWSNPYLLPIRLPYSGYLDATTLATGVWLPLSLLAGYTLARFGAWVLTVGPQRGDARSKAWVGAASAATALALLAGGGASALGLSTMLDNKPYIARADLDALQWMNAHLPKDAYVLANPFAFPWDSPPQAIQGSDAGLWVPLLTGGVRSSVPPVPAYNERQADPNYLKSIREIVGSEPFEGTEAVWSSLKDAGVTHIFVGSRGGALDVKGLLQSDHVRLVYHEDSVWLFELV